MSRHAFVDHRTRLLVFWTPKVGCTSLAHWFVLGALGKKKGFVRDTAYTGAREWLVGEGYSVDFEEAYDLAVHRGYDSCIVARHPVARAISAYIDKFVLHEGRPLDSRAALQDFAAKEYDRWTRSWFRLLPSRYRGLSFVEFLTHINRAVVARRAGREARLNHHWNAQVPFYFRERGFRYGTVFQLERFGDAIAWLNARYGVEVEMPRRFNATTYGTESRAGLEAVSSLELCRKPEWLTRENFISPETLDLIERAYAIDYEYFGYNPRATA